MIVFILIVIGLFFLLRALLPYIRPYIYRWFVRRAFRQFGQQMDPFASRSTKNNNKKKTSGRKRNPTPPPHDSRNNGPIIPTEYAEDVDFVEIHSYSEETKIGNNRVETIVEEQISDAEIIEIRTNSSKSSSHK